MIERLRSPEPDPPKAIRRGLRVLVVDDNPMILAILGEILPTQECDVVLSRNPVSAINVFVSERPDAVMLDYCMPGMDGVELSQALHTLDPDCPLVMLTAFDDPGVRDRARRVGVGHFLTKPFLLRDLERVLGLLRQSVVPLAPVAEAL